MLMKTSATTPYRFAGIALIGTALLLSACSKTHDASTSSTTATSTAATGATVNATDTWDSIKGYSYTQKAEFAAKANEVAARLERDAATAKGNAANRLAEARDDLRTAATEIGTASADTWEATKERVGRALQKAESAYQNAAE